MGRLGSRWGGKGKGEMRRESNVKTWEREGRKVGRRRNSIVKGGKRNGREIYNGKSKRSWGKYYGVLEDEQKVGRR